MKDGGLRRSNFPGRLSFQRHVHGVHCIPPGGRGSETRSGSDSQLDVAAVVFWASLHTSMNVLSFSMSWALFVCMGKRGRSFNMGSFNMGLGINVS